jgi:uncharacterized protein (DUF169 family)
MLHNDGEHMNYQDTSNTIKEILKLETSPVSVKLFENEEEAKSILEKTESIMHCQAIITASKGYSFYGSGTEIGCQIGAGILGLNEISEDTLNGTKFNQMNVTSTQENGKKLIDSVPKYDKRIEAIGYMPLEKTKIKPDVIVIIAKPRQIFDLIRANAYPEGKKMDNSVGGTQSLCGDIVINSIITNEAHISFGCMGSHMATELQEDQVIIGIPISKLEEITNSLKIQNQR